MAVSTTAVMVFFVVMFAAAVAVFLVVMLAAAMAGMLLLRSKGHPLLGVGDVPLLAQLLDLLLRKVEDRKSTRLNSSHAK